jgi:hypothetical protein
VRFPIAVVVAATVGGLTLYGCTTDTDSAPDVQRQHTARVYAGRLPNTCDDLISPVTVAQMLHAADLGQRTYTYQAAGDASGLLRGMTCQHGVGPEVTTLSVSAQEFDTRAAARKHYAAAGAGLAGARDVRVAKRPGALSESPSSSSVVVLDGPVIVEVELGPAATGSPPSRRTLLTLAREVVSGVDGAQ